MSDCSRCPARLVWGRTVAGKALPLDAHDNGRLRRYPARDASANVAVDCRVAPNVDGQLSVRVLKKGEQPTADEVRAMPHFATCPGWSR